MEESIRRQWRWYSPRDDEPVTKQEFQKLPKHGQGALIAAMKRYAQGDDRGGMLKRIENNLFELRVQVGTDPFRILFFHDSPVHCIVLHVFYKNQQKLPLRAKELAKKRRARWQRVHELQ
ncbi:type II toxin-antitoxin system RelE/ParE family toxin [Arthrobacter sp. Helios]|uniref:type II toxin-antitoxin system RelE/ParE family toxin n=1 Tax=Arthrobacter sp. Helios TaxID=2828862 RepID=UPI00204A9E8A|nr:type II toxin-antitoxin system RelE/ParE family toxin [Arthrobacter sp. Helios]UPO77734.1 type II toxin-antitoxin system RelE/ParE family toxin [Arthrobacter sp. Helios]